MAISLAKQYVQFTGKSKSQCFTWAKNELSKKYEIVMTKKELKKIKKQFTKLNKKAKIQKGGKNEQTANSKICR